MDKAINIIFDGPPSHESGRFMEVETDDGKSITAGEWVEREDGLWALRITTLPKEAPQQGDPAEAINLAVHNCNDNIVGESPNYFCGICGQSLR